MNGRFARVTFQIVVYNGKMNGGYHKNIGVFGEKKQLYIANRNQEESVVSWKKVDNGEITKW